jgi:hypothetical protein
MGAIHIFTSSSAALPLLFLRHLHCLYFRSGYAILFLKQFCDFYLYNGFAGLMCGADMRLLFPQRLCRFDVR